MILRYKPSVSCLDVLLGPFQRNNPGVPEYFNGTASWHASASNALVDILLRSKRTGKVMLPSYTCDRVVRAVLAADCEPVFCDVDELGRMNIQAVEDNEYTGLVAVVASHMFGAPPDRSFFRQFCDRNNALYIEDCAIASYEQLFESMSSPVPDACVYSFGKGKPISLGFGGLGVIKHNDKFTVRDVYSERSYKNLSLVGGLGAIFGYTSVIWKLRIFLESHIKKLIGYKPGQAINFDRLPLILVSRSMQSCLSGLVFRALDKTDVKHLRKLSSLYRKRLGYLGEAWSEVMEKDTAPFYPLVVEDRQSLYTYLLRKGINVASYFAYSAGAEYTGKSYSGSERLAERILLLPLHDGVSEEMVKKICRLVREWVSTHEDVSAC